MTLDDLRAHLDALNLPGDTPIVCVRDAEGNGYSPLTTVDDALYGADTEYSGAWYADPELRAANPGEWDEAPDGAKPAIFLWPAN